MYNSLAKALLGSILWRSILQVGEKTLILIIPKFDKKMILALLSVLPNYLDRMDGLYEHTQVVYSQPDIYELIAANAKEKVTFLRLSQLKMDFLISFVALSFKQYGACCKKNVKLVSLDELYGGQLHEVMQSDVLPIEAIVRDKMLFVN